VSGFLTRVAELEFFGWGGIPNNTMSGSRFFKSDADSRGPIESFLLHTPKLGIPIGMVQILVKLLLKQSNFQ